LPIGDEYGIAYQSCCDDDEDIRSCDDMMMVMGMMRHLTREVEYFTQESLFLINGEAQGTVRPNYDGLVGDLKESSRVGPNRKVVGRRLA
jgi:hypothetical protein